MRTFIFLLVFIPCYLLTITVQAAVQLGLQLSDIERAPSAAAIVTFSGDRGKIHALSFSNVPNLQSCFKLAFLAAGQGRESTATCVDVMGKIMTTFYCEPAKGGKPSCSSKIPLESH